MTKESDQVRERYGDGKPYHFQFDGVRRSTIVLWRGGWWKPASAW